MGCVTSKHVVRSSDYPCDSNSNSNLNNDHDHPPHTFTKIKKRIQDDDDDADDDDDDLDGEASDCDSINFKFRRLVESEHVAAGWPSWLSAVAGEAIDGWLPLKPDSYERLGKIGQGTYSSVYRARHTESGRTVALKKVHFDTLLPGSVKFMAREITILRKLHHPNIMKLEGIITSKLSSNVYFVFEYMEHDLAALLSCHNIKFSESQIKCYMRQFLTGIEHCHSLGILHRDVKPANILVNDEGVLKIADFGLASFDSPQSLTSHVVTLWYRPPELLLGCTRYGTYVDLWSAGCVFAELFLGRPILKARTEVEQLHKIFKLCGTPPDDYWNKSKLPLAMMFKPHISHESMIRETCKELPKTAVNLISTLLSMEPRKRGTARSALDSEYFKTKPYACDPASLPKYPPTKEIDPKIRRAKCGASRNPTTCQEQTSFCKVVPTENDANVQFPLRNNGGDAYSRTFRGSSKPIERSQYGSICMLPTQPTTSNGGFLWAAGRQKHREYTIR